MSGADLAYAPIRQVWHPHSGRLLYRPTRAIGDVWCYALAMQCPGTDRLGPTHGRPYVVSNEGVGASLGSRERTRDPHEAKRRNQPQLSGKSSGFTPSKVQDSNLPGTSSGAITSQVRGLDQEGGGNSVSGQEEERKREGRSWEEGGGTREKEEGDAVREDGDVEVRARGRGGEEGDGGGKGGGGQGGG
eukprot:2113814-Rhodomonas_salina.1